MAKSVLITGCSSGIGLHTAHYLKARGYRVLATARKAADVELLADQGFESHLLDLDCDTSITEAVAWAANLTQGKIDALFNNGAYGQPGAVEDLSRDALRQQLETNVLGTHELTRQVLPLMRAQGHGRIIQNSSVLGLVALKFRGAYVCSKFALEGLSDTLRHELKGSNIYVSLVEPGPITSKFRENAYQAFKQHINIDSSPHRAIYQAVEARLANQSPDKPTPFNLEPEAVAAKVLKAIESKKPKPRYYVTFPTYLFAYLRRICTTGFLDRVMLRVSDDENKA
ncbi:MAG: SDR family NAD(P)-dependent oxidoreductase [Pontibacterium sp.]